MELKGGDPLEYYNQHDVGERIKLVRVKAGLTQSELAERIDASVSQIYRIENGKSGHTVDKLVEIAQILDVSTDYLLLGKDDTDRQNKKVNKFILNTEKIFQEIINGKSEKEVAYAIEVLKSILSNIDILTT